MTAAAAVGGDAAPTIVATEIPRGTDLSVEDGKIWYAARVVETREGALKVHFMGRKSSYDEWISVDSPRLRLPKHFKKKPAAVTIAADGDGAAGSDDAGCPSWMEERRQLLERLDAATTEAAKLRHENASLAGQMSHLVEANLEATDRSLGWRLLALEAHVESHRRYYHATRKKVCVHLPVPLAPWLR